MTKEPRVVLGEEIEKLPPLMRWIRLFWPLRKLVLKGPTLATHARVLGTTGVGKTGLLKSIVWQLLRSGVGVAFIDPHGDAVEQLLMLLIHSGYFERENAFDKIWYIEFRSDEDGDSLPFNVLNATWMPPHDVVSSVLDAFFRVWPSLAEGSAPYFTEAMRRGLRVLVDNNMTLFSLDRVLRDKRFRDPLLPQVKDADVVSYFQALDSLKDERLREERIVTAVNRVELMKDAPVLKYSLGQQENRLNFNQIIDTPISLLINLHPVRDPEARAMLGALLTKFFEEAALSRESGRPRTQYHLIIDEAAEFVSKSGISFAKMLAETRKYNMFAMFAHQDLAQLKGELRSAMQNVGIEMSLRVGSEDAKEMTRRLAIPLDLVAVKAQPVNARSQPVFASVQEQRELQQEDLANLKARHVVVRIPPKPPVLIKTLDVPTPQVDLQRLEEVKMEYRRRLMTPRNEIILPHQTPIVTGTTTKRNSP